MFDAAHWRSAITTRPGIYGVVNVASATDPTAAPGRGWAGQPDYGKLVASASVLTARTCATDPPPPLRTCDSFYLPQTFPAEFLSQPNAIVEDVDPRSNHEQLQSTLDTLYMVIGPSGQAPVMTYYHGTEGGSVVFSGFPIWHFQRTQCAALTDFVLQDIWGMTRQAPQAAGAQRSTVVSSLRRSAQVMGRLR